MRWRRVTKFDPRAVALADRHYSRGQPGTPQFMPAGRSVVLLTEDARAVWGTIWSVGEGIAWATHDWPHAWNCSIFRNEGDDLSSDLIREAVAANRALWGDPPEQGMVTFVDVDQVRRKRDPGRCFLRAGFRRIGWTRSGKLVLQLAAGEFPEPDAPLGVTMQLEPGLGIVRDGFVPKRDVHGGGMRRYS